MEWLIRLAVIWLSIDVITVATAWYLVTVIKPRFPDWWRREIVGEDPLEGTPLTSQKHPYVVK